MFSLEDDVIVSEILWTIKCCVSGFSFSSNEGLTDVFKLMFHDSKIASNYQMSYTKMQYVLEFGIMPFIKENILSDFRETAFTIKFDETFTD